MTQAPVTLTLNFHPLKALLLSHGGVWDILLGGANQLKAYLHCKTSCLFFLTYGASGGQTRVWLGRGRGPEAIVFLLKELE